MTCNGARAPPNRVFQGHLAGKVPGEAPRRVGEKPGEEEEAWPEGLGGCYCLAQTDQVQPTWTSCGSSPPTPARRRWRRNAPGRVEPHDVPQVTDGVLNLGVAAVVGLEMHDTSARSVVKRDSRNW